MFRMNLVVFGETTKNIRVHIDKKPVEALNLDVKKILSQLSCWQSCGPSGL